MTTPDAVTLALDWLRRGTFVAAGLALLLCAAMVIAGRRSRSGLARDGLAGAVWVLGGLALAACAATVAGVVVG